MDDFHNQLSRIQNLGKKDIIIARTLVRNGWVDPVCVLMAAEAAAQDPAGPTLLYRLTRDGKLEAERARQIGEALERRIAQRAGLPVPATSEAPPEPSLAPAPAEADEVVAAARELLKSHDDAERPASAQFFATYLRSELRENLMARIVDSLGGDANPAELAGATGASQDAVEEILAQWQEHGLLGSAPDSRFHFAPSPRQKKTIAKHLSWWRDGAERERCIETLREEAYAGYVAHTRECMDALSRSLEEERAGRAAVESNLRGSVEAVAAATAQLEEARRNADTLRSELERARGEVAQANNMVSLKDQLIAQLMKEQDAHRVLERDHAELLKKHKELGEEFEKAVEAAREAEQLDVARMPWRLSAGTMTRAS